MANPMLQKMMELLTHHYNLSGALSREAAARGMGIDPEPYKHPYPGSTNYTFQVVTPGEATATAKAESGPSPQAPPPAPVVSSAGQRSGLVPVILSGLAAAGLATGVAAVLWPKETPPTTQQAPVINVPGQPGLDAQVEVEWGPGKGENGQFGARYRLGPNGQWVVIPQKPPQ